MRPVGRIGAFYLSSQMHRPYEQIRHLIRPCNEVATNESISDSPRSRSDVYYTLYYSWQCVFSTTTTSRGHTGGGAFFFCCIVFFVPACSRIACLHFYREKG